MGTQSKNRAQRRITAQSFCRLNERLAFARKMVDTAEDSSKAEEVFAFFCYFVAFNILYGYWEDDQTRSYQAVKKFMENEYASGSVVIHPGFSDKFPHLTAKVGNGRQVVNQIHGSENHNIENESNHDIKVFMRILQIRNNLFHGSKDLNDSRDMPLIREANTVLREFLLDYFNRRDGGES